MTVALERRLLQIIVAVACCVPVFGGLWGIWHGTGRAGDIDSHYRYLSGLLLGIGLAFASSITRIEDHAERFRLLTAIVVLGGLARLAGMIMAGAPSLSMELAMVMEIVVTPVLCLWQNSLARRYPG